MQGETKRLIEVCVPDLIAYPDQAYARRDADVVRRAFAAETTAVPHERAFREAAARHLHKLKAYKDEYEVARLHSDAAFKAQLDAMFPNGYSMKYKLALPMIAKREPETGRLSKRQCGPWMKTALGWLMKLRRLPGDGLDVFGITKERAQERKMIQDCIKELDALRAMTRKCSRFPGKSAWPPLRCPPAPAQLDLGDSAG